VMIHGVASGVGMMNPNDPRCASFLN
jgi:hypothetical protein